MSVAVLVPFRGGCPYRERNWAYVHDRYERAGFDVVIGTSDAEGFSRTQAILDARAQSDADVFVIADADVVAEGLDDGIAKALLHGWAVPNGLLWRLCEQSTRRFLAGENWRGLPLSQDNPQDSRPYKVHEGGTLLCVSAEAFDIAPPDPRFVKWGQEDDAWAATLHTLVGKGWRGKDDVVHLWHPAEPRKTRITGNDANRALLQRYHNARNAPDLMRGLVEEGRSWRPTSSSTEAGYANS